MKHRNRFRSFVQAPQTLTLAFCLLSIPLGLILFVSQPMPVLAASNPPIAKADSSSALPNLTIFVTNTNDSGVGSLRDAITQANASAGTDTITITATGVIVLSSMLPAITDTLAINGPGASLLNISGNNAVRVMQVNAGVSVNLSNVAIANGNVPSSGGGIYNTGTLTLTYTTFYSNTATNSGGGIYNTGTLTITNSTIYSNTAGTMGGGIASEGTLNISNSTVYSNTATNIGGGGIGSSGMLNITSSTVRNNSALNNGGGILSNGAGTISNSTFHANTSLGDSNSAGGIFNAGNLTVTNSTVTDNISGNGGGIRNDGTLTVTNTTIYSNTATSYAGGILNYGTTTLRNTIVANSPSGGNCGGTITDGGNNLQFGGEVVNSCGAGITTADPKLAPLANNGGSTQTMALLPGSPAIDGVTLNAPNGCPSSDQRGWHRPYGSYCDIGAYERGAFVYLPLILK
jgi:predicted outer membrane repeat protein